MYRAVAAMLWDQSLMSRIANASAGPHAGRAEFRGSLHGGRPLATSYEILKGKFRGRRRYDRARHAVH
jgi:hypothetical protein